MEDRDKIKRFIIGFSDELALGKDGDIPFTEDPSTETTNFTEGDTVDEEELVPKVLYKKIAVAIPFKNAETLESLMHEAKSKGADVIEIRFDYHPGLKEYAEVAKSIINGKAGDEAVTLLNDLAEDTIRDILPPAEFKRIKEDLTVPIIFTVRHADEGGVIRIPEPARIALIEKLIPYIPDYIDLEYRTDRNIIEKLNGLCSEYGVDIIFSHHNFNETPSEGEIIRIINGICGKCPDVVPAPGNIPPRNVIKIIFRANRISDNFRVLKICLRYAALGYKIICFCMGEMGLPSRIGSLLTGAYMSYAAIGDSTAPGQPHITEFKEYLLEAEKKAQLGGDAISGGPQSDTDGTDGKKDSTSAV